MTSRPISIHLRLHPAVFAGLMLMSSASLCVAAGDPMGADANTVIGPNALLADGAAALLKGQWERGIQLTHLGLGSAVSREDRAAGFANLCAGYAALREYQRALDNCNQSLAIFDGNWRAWQNRAAANLGLGRVEDSLRDIQRGLQINPGSDALQKTLAIARSYEKLRQERRRELVES
jgi:tetratricopeptide (TPR) repeat protein